MEINISPRRSGKTTRLIDWVKKGEDRVVLFATTEEASYLKKQYPEIADNLYYWVDWKEKKDINKEIGIDNADCVLHKVFGRSIQKLEFNQELIKKYMGENNIKKMKKYTVIEQYWPGGAMGSIKEEMQRVEAMSDDEAIEKAKKRGQKSDGSYRITNIETL